jgi:glycosyltransferase involved in cell wall biosynthesis
MRVIYWNNIPSPYFVERLDRLARRGNVEVEAWFSQRSEPDRSWLVEETGWPFSYRYLGVQPMKAAASAARFLRRQRPDVLFCLYERPEYFAVALGAQVAGIPVVLHAMKTFDSQRPRRRQNELAKRVLFPRVSGIQVPGADAASYVQEYGASASTIYTFPEPVDVGFFSSAAAASKRNEIRTRLGVSGCTYLYVGRLWRHKGVHHLLEAYRSVMSNDADVSLIVVGDGVDEQELRSAAGSLPRVRFTGFVQKTDLPEIYAAADVFVFPTLGDTYGHVIQEAMAAGLPIITTTSVGDISDRVGNCQTGFLVPPCDPCAMAEVMLRLANEPDLRHNMGQAARSHIASRTIDWWANEFEELVGAVACR